MSFPSMKVKDQSLRTCARRPSPPLTAERAELFADPHNFCILGVLLEGFVTPTIASLDFLPLG